MFVAPATQQNRVLAASPPLLDWYAADGLEKNPVGKTITQWAILVVQHYLWVKREIPEDGRKALVVEQCINSLAKRAMEIPDRFIVIKRFSKRVHLQFITNHFTSPSGEMLGTFSAFVEHSIPPEEVSRLLALDRFVSPTPEEILFIHCVEMVRSLKPEDRHGVIAGLRDKHNAPFFQEFIHKLS